MSKKTRKSSRKTPKKSGKSPVRHKRLPEPALEVLQEADDRIAAEDWDEAYERLLELDEVFPRRAEILDRLVQVCVAMEDLEEVVRYAEQLQRLRPEDGEVAFRLGIAYFATGNSALALEMLRRADRLMPLEDDTVADLRGVLEVNVAETAQMLRLSGGQAAVAALERARLALNRERPEEARRPLESILAHQPDSLVALNQLSRVEFSEGHLEQALAALERVPGEEPREHTSRELKVRYLAALGRRDEARETALALAEMPVFETPDEWLTLIQGLLLVGEGDRAVEICGAAHQAFDELEQEQEEVEESFLEENGEEVAEALEELGRDLDDQEPDEEDLEEPFTSEMDQHRALLLHLEAVAALDRGDEARARDLWEQALALNPELLLARENLEDLDNPPHERHTPWAFDQNYLLPIPLMKAVVERLEPVVEAGRPEAIQRAARTVLKRHPALLGLMPLCLEQGGPRLREMMVELAEMASTPQVLAILKDFTFSTRGPDALRLRACQLLDEKGVIENEGVQLWLKGKWQEVNLQLVEVSGDPLPEIRHSPQMESLMERAMKRLREGDGAGAEQLLRDALKLEPTALDARFNLSQALKLQGQADEARRMVEELHREHPDYLFAAATKAQMLLDEGQVDQAEAILGRLMNRERFHFSQMEMLFDVRVQLEFARKNPKGAFRVLKEWEELNPRSAGLLSWRERILEGAQLGLEQGGIESGDTP